jgi:hypothetical protein
MDEVRRAFRNTLGRKGMLERDTDRLAEYLMDHFGFDDRIIDSRLSSEDRDVFYMLEEVGFLTSNSEEILIQKGKLWRIHYWVLKTDQIQRQASLEFDSAHLAEGMPIPYDEIADGCWNRG